MYTVFCILRQYTCTSMFSSFCFQRILRIQNPVYMYIYVLFFLFPDNTENTEPIIQVHLCFLPSVSREYWEYRTQYICTSMFCILSIVLNQKEENIGVHVYWVLYSLYSLETERRKHRCTCTCILGSVYVYIYVFLFLFPVHTKNTNPVYIYIYVFFFLFPEKTDNTEPSIHVHLENIDVHVYCVLYSQYSLETELRKHRCKSILGSVFSVFSGNRKKKT
jgi:hypothetical protein